METETKTIKTLASAGNPPTRFSLHPQGLVFKENEMSAATKAMALVARSAADGIEYRVTNEKILLKKLTKLLREATSAMEAKCVQDLIDSVKSSLVNSESHRVIMGMIADVNEDHED